MRRNQVPAIPPDHGSRFDFLQLSASGSSSDAPSLTRSAATFELSNRILHPLVTEMELLGMPVLKRSPPSRRLPVMPGVHSIPI